jgi:hypothetical protein
MMVFDHGSGEGGRALWMENVLSAGGGAGAAQYGPTSLRSLPPYPNPPVPARYYPTYNTPYLVRVSQEQWRCLSTSVADPDLGSGAFLTSGSGIRDG